MVDQNLVSYIKQQMAAGYDINSIRQAMLNYGYDPKAVEDAINSATGAAAGFPILPVAAGVLLIAVIIGAFLIFSGGAEKRLLDLQTSTMVNEVNAGDMLSFFVELTNMGSAKRYDVSLVHQLLDSDGKIINSKQETAAVETRAATISKMNIPSSASPGTYKLMTTASYDSKTANSFFMINVKKAEAPAEEKPPVAGKECPASCDDFDSCTRDICDETTDFSCAHFALTPCCGNNVCETGEDNSHSPVDCKAEVVPEEKPEEVKEITIKDIINTAKETAQRSKSEAESYCSGLEKEYHKDSCYGAVAEQTNSSISCEKIISDTSRDNCYTNFALAGDYTVCEKLTNKYLKASCISLSQAS